MVQWLSTQSDELSSLTGTHTAARTELLHLMSAAALPQDAALVHCYDSYLEHHHLLVVCLKGVCPGGGHEALGRTHKVSAERGKEVQERERPRGWFQSHFLGRGSPTRTRWQTHSGTLALLTQATCPEAGQLCLPGENTPLLGVWL